MMGEGEGYGDRKMGDRKIRTVVFAAGKVIKRP